MLRLAYRKVNVILFYIWRGVHIEQVVTFEAHGEARCVTTSCLLCAINAPLLNENLLSVP